MELSHPQKLVGEHFRDFSISVTAMEDYMIAPPRTRLPRQTWYNVAEGTSVKTPNMYHRMQLHVATLLYNLRKRTLNGLLI
jgi:hypothetical protein